MTVASEDYDPGLGKVTKMLVSARQYTWHDWMDECTGVHIILFHMSEE